MTKTTKKSNKKSAPKSETTAVQTVSDAPMVWNAKYEACTQCESTERKHYSGGLCTRCYTEKRNARLGIGTANPANIQKKKDYLDRKIAELQYRLSEATAARTALDEKLKSVA